MTEQGVARHAGEEGKLGAFQRVCREHGLALVYLFGSQVANALRMLHGEDVELRDPLADIDIGVVTARPLPSDARGRLDMYTSLYCGLADFFAPYAVDLVLLEEHHSVFQAEALAGVCVFEASSAFRDRYEMSVLRRAADFKPFLDRFYQEVLEEV
ncbi:MAG: nucleotidyltransferase domain-containing protein [Bacillota bacterium]|nr:nucleotidyltransferase domain-containing protein [Bacillota bacterium]